LADENPFIEEEHQKATRCGYIYKIWKIQDKTETTDEMKICIRCSVHTHTGRKGENGEQQFMNVYAFNEHNLDRSNWVKNID